ncbi:hypothetical protein U703_09690 [Rhodobacter capsulatus YW1]|nr:hypothetical protein U703_09690 [Rhodobacter capsulatus YW1]
MRHVTSAMASVKTASLAARSDLPPGSQPFVHSCNDTLSFVRTNA